MNEPDRNARYWLVLTMHSENLLALATDIITAHISHNKVPPERLPELISIVYGALASLGRIPERVAEERKPAVSIRLSITPEAITCLECGRKFKVLRRHLSTDHHLTPEEYRRRWNLAADYPIVAADYAETRKNLAIMSGLGSKINRNGQPNAVQPAFQPRNEAFTPN